MWQMYNILCAIVACRYMYNCLCGIHIYSIKTYNNIICRYTYSTFYLILYIKPTRNNIELKTRQRPYQIKNTLKLPA